MSDDEKNRTGPGALRCAQLVGQRAAQRGFDWDDYRGPLAKVYEEVAELEQAIGDGEGPLRQGDELGDLLFSVVNLARHLELDAEGALHGAIDKFERRFAQVDKKVSRRHPPMEEMPIEALEALWQESKAEE